jgi:YVTN family beta-propeller protein
MRSRHAAGSFVLLIVLFFQTATSPQALAQEKSKAAPPRGGSAESPSAPPSFTQTYTREGVSVEFSVEPVASGQRSPATPVADAEATVRFKIFDVNGGDALGNLRPTAWIDRRGAAPAPDARECREKVQRFLQPDFNNRPTVDLNSYFILALNREPSISVIDPLSGFGGSRLYALVPLPGPGEDWAMSADKKRLYVSMPLVNQVAVVDTTAWKVVANIDAGAKPSRVALQHDGRYLWVGNDDDAAKGGGVTMIDTVTLKVAARIRTGAGHHEIALTDDDATAFVTNKLDGTLSVIDVRGLASVADIKVGSLPAAAAFSPLGKAVYVADEGDGVIVAVDAARREVIARMKARPGLRAVRVTADGRYGFAVNRETATVFIFDAATNWLIHEVPAGASPDQVAFTRQFAYVRSSADEFVTMINLAGLEREAAVTRFPAGQKAPKDSPADSLADAVVPAPEGDAVLVANPADKMIYFYTEGMAAPMGSFQNYRRDPKALLVLDNSLREGARGVYSTTVRLPAAGRYDVVFLLDAPRMVNCFEINVAENPDQPTRAARPLKVEPLPKDAGLRTGEGYSLRFRVSDAASNQPLDGIEDVGVLVFLAPGIWQQRGWAKPVGPGVYEISFVPPQDGVYYVYFQCPSAGLSFNQVSPLILRASKR